MPNYQYNYSTSSNIDAAVLAKILPYLAIIVGIVLIFAIFILVCNWFIYKKAGRPGWSAIVPYYNTYVLVQIVGRPMWFFWVILAAGLVGFIPVVGQMIGFIFSIVSLVLNIIITIDLAKVFGKNGWFAALLIFLPFIGYPILAFGSATYQGPKSNSGIDPLNPVVPANDQPQNSQLVITPDQKPVQKVEKKLPPLEELPDDGSAPKIKKL